VGEGRDPKRGFDAAFIGAGGPLTGVLALGTAVVLRSWAHSGGAGPTAATLDEAFRLLWGAAIGLVVGTAFVAFAARTGRRILTGLLAGLLGYAVVLAPVLVATAPDDVSAADSIWTAVFAGMLLIPAIVVGAAAGAGIAAYRENGLYRRVR